MVALEEARRADGGEEEYHPPPISRLTPDEARYHTELRRNSYQGSTPSEGSIGPAPWYLRLRDAADYATQRLALHRQEVARLQALLDSGRYVRPPESVAADCVEAGLPLAVPALAGHLERVQASIPARLLRAAGHAEGRRNVGALVAALPSLVASYGLLPDEVEALQTTARAWPALPPPPERVLQRLAAAVVAGLPVVEREDEARRPCGGLAVRLPPADVWRCETWERLRRDGREVPPLPW